MAGATFLSMFTLTHFGEVGKEAYSEFMGASTLEKGDSISWNTVFAIGDESDKTEWKYGKKTNKLLGFLFWTVLLLGVVGGAAYFLM